MDDVSISGTLQGMYNGLAQQQDAYGRARFYNSLASNNQYNLQEQQLEAQKNRDFGNLLSNNMRSIPAEQPQQQTTQPQPQTPAAPQTTQAGLSQMGQPYPMATTAPTAALDRQAMLQRQQQMAQPQPQTPAAPQPQTPAAPQQQAPMGQSDERQQMIQAYQQAQGKTPTLTSLADHPAIQASLATTPNTHPNTVLATDPDNPTFSSQHTFVSTDPQTGQVTKNTFNRQGLIDQMMNYTDKNGNHSMAADANKLMAQFTASDAADEKIKQDGIMVANGKALQLSAGLEYMSPADQAAVFGNLKDRATQMGADTTTWPSGPSDPNFQPWVQQQGEEARMNANTAKEASKRAEDAFNEQKAQAEAGKDTAQGLEAQAKAGTEPSIRNKNNADAFKLYQEGLKAKTEAANLGIGGTNGIVSKLEDVPAQYQPMVQDLASGKLQISDLPARTGAGQISRNQFLSWTSQVYPGWDPRLSAQSKKTIMDFSPNGQSGKQVTSFGAIAEHTQILRQAYDAMNNGSIPALNAMAGTIGAGVGDSPKTTFNNMASVYAGEIDKTFSGNNPTEGGARTWSHNLNYSMSPKQAKGAFDVLDTAVTGKLQPIDQAYYNASGKHLADTNLLTPAAKNLASRFGGVTPGSATPAGVSIGMKALKSDGSVLQDGKYNGFTVQNGVVNGLGR